MTPPVPVTRTVEGRLVQVGLVPWSGDLHITSIEVIGTVWACVRLEDNPGLAFRAFAVPVVLDRGPSYA